MANLYNYDKTVVQSAAKDQVATTTADGLMSAEDKAKLDGIATGANNYTHPGSHPATMIVQDPSHEFVTNDQKFTWNSKAEGNHNHDGVYEPIFTKNTAFNKNFGKTAGTVCQGNDSRLTNKRTPVNHHHPYNVQAGHWIFDDATNTAYIFQNVVGDVGSQLAKIGFFDTSNPNLFNIQSVLGGFKLLNGNNYHLSFNNVWFYPGGNDQIWNGTTANRWKGICSASAVDVSSDRRLKHDIVYMDELPTTFEESGENVLEKLFFMLKPSMFGLNSEEETENNKIHMGFIAQDVSQALQELGMNETDTAFLSHAFWTDEETKEEKDTYGIPYTEYIALNTHMIQKCFSKLEEQQNEINELKSQILQLL